MSAESKPEIGQIGWTDLTIENADEARDFYAAVVGWNPSPVDMGGYSDYNMNAPASGEPRAGVCHARGVNADLPPVWMVYITVEDVDASAAKCVELGGKMLAGPKSYGGQGRYCVIQDPAGAVVALYSSTE